MVSSVPKWVWERYSKLWKAYQDRELDFSEIQKVLKGDERNAISVCLNELKNAGWIEVKRGTNDQRKRKYVLRNPEMIVLEADK